MKTSNPFSEEILEQAADWLDQINYERSGVNRAKFEAWLNASPQHQAAFDFMQRMLGCEEIDAVCHQQQQTPKRLPLDCKVTELKARSDNRKGAAPFFAKAASVALLIGLGTWLISQSPSDQHSTHEVVLQQPISEKHSTLVGEIKMAALADGTQVMLNGDSQLQVTQTANLRGAALTQGEAYFDVAHDASRPFVIATDLGQIQVLGTAFDVEVTQQSLTVTVDRGHVRVGKKPGYDLFPGERLILYRNGEVSQQKVDTGNRLDWRTGWLELSHAPLSQLLNQLQRFTDKQVISEPELLAEVTLTGRFNLKDPEQTFELLAQLESIEIYSTEHSIYLSQRE